MASLNVPVCYSSVIAATGTSPACSSRPGGTSASSSFSVKRVNVNASKPRHVPAFCDVWNAQMEEFFSSLCDNPSDLNIIRKYYQLGIIGLKRVQKDDNHVEGFIADICRRSTRLTIDRQGFGVVRGANNPLGGGGEGIEGNGSADRAVGGGNSSGNGLESNNGPMSPGLKSSFSTAATPAGRDYDPGTLDEGDYWTASIGFTNRSKRWTMCPSRVCCGSAVDRDKIVGQWKILQLDATGSKLIVPPSVRESYDSIMDDADYFVCTLCPQQTYHAKHVPQGSDVVFDKQWHYMKRYKYPQDILVFTDDELITRIVWLLNHVDPEVGNCRVDGKVSKYDGGAEVAEAKLLSMMVRVMGVIRKGDMRLGGSSAALCIEGRRNKPTLIYGDTASNELHSRIF